MISMTTLEARPCLFPLCCRSFILVAAGRKWLRLAFISSDFYHDDPDDHDPDDEGNDQDGE